MSLPREVGVWTLEQGLARGGQGAVYVARDPQGRTGALKVLLHGAEVDRRRFAREIETLARLSHPNLARLLDHGQLPTGVPWLVTELIEGESLQRRSAQGPFAVSWTVALLTRVAEALARCHDQGLVHRDLKPSNLVVERGSDRPVLIDFGLVGRDPELTQGGFERLTQTGEIMGSPSFLAPEQVDARLGSPGPLSDVYGLGATLFFCLTGRPPIEAETTMEALQRVLTQPAQDPRRYRPEVSPALAELCQSCLAKAPARRPQSMAALLTRLRAVPEERRPSPPRTLSAVRVALRRAGPPLWALGAAAGLIGAALAVSTVLVTRRDRRSPPPLSPQVGSVPSQPDSPAPSVTRPRPQPTFSEPFADGPLIPPPRAPRPGPFFDPSEPALDEALTRAKRLLAAGRGQDALTLCEKALTSFPTDAELHYHQALAHFLLEDYARVRRATTATIELDPEHADALHLRALVRRLDDPTGAAADFERSLTLQPDPSVHANYADFLLKRGQPDRALEHAERSLAGKPDHSLASVLRARSLVELGRAEAARAQLQRALEVPPPTELLLDAAKVAELLGDLQHAESLLTQCSRRLPRDPRPLQGRAHVRLLRAMKPSGGVNAQLARAALADSEAVLRLSAGTYVDHELRGVALVMLGRPRESLAAFERALTGGPTVRALTYRSRALMQLGATAEAARDLRGALRLADPTERVAVLDMGRALGIPLEE